MNKEIEEILDKLKYSTDNTIDTEIDQFTEEAYDVPNYFVLDPTTNECRILLDYITNLQEEVKEYEMIFDTFSSRPYAHRYLEEKRKELNNPHIIGLDSEMIYKDYYDLKEEHEKCTRKHWQSKCAEYSITNKLLQNIIDKAIEYIEQEDWNAEYDKKLLDILRGDE